MSELKERMAVLEQLNLAIVAARKRGEHDEVTRLKVKVERFLSATLSVTSDVATPSSPSHSTQQTPSAVPLHTQASSSTQSSLTAPPLSKEVAVPEVSTSISTSISVSVSAPTSDDATSSASNALDTYDMMAIMRELSAVNLQIVEARKAGDEMQVKRLQKRAEALMKMGSR